MAKAKANSNPKSDRKKPAPKGIAAKPKAKPIGSKKAAPAKEAKKTASSAKKLSTRPAAASGSGGEAAGPQARVADEGSSSKASKPGGVAAKEAVKTPEAPGPEPKAPVPKPVVQGAQAGPTSVEAAKAHLPEAALQVSAPAKQEPKPEYEAIGPNTLDGFQLPAVYGKAGVFGGSKDRSAKPDDKLALPTG